MTRIWTAPAALHSFAEEAVDLAQAIKAGRVDASGHRVRLIAGCGAVIDALDGWGTTKDTSAAERQDPLPFPAGQADTEPGSSGFGGPHLPGGGDPR